MEPTGIAHPPSSSLELEGCLLMPGLRRCVLGDGPIFQSLGLVVALANISHFLVLLCAESDVERLATP